MHLGHLFVIARRPGGANTIIRIHDVALPKILQGLGDLSESECRELFKTLDSGPQSHRQASLLGWVNVELPR